MIRPPSSGLLLLVEGANDAITLKQMLRRDDITGVDVKSVQGKNNFREEVTSLIRASSEQRIGVIADTDRSISGGGLLSRWAESLGMLADLGCSGLPKIVPKDGLVVKSGNTLLGYYLIPDNETDGAMEDLLLRAVPRRLAPVLETAEQGVRLAEGLPTALRFPEKDRSKALLSTYFAWVHKPRSHGGLGFSSENYLDAEHPDIRRLLSWVRRLLQYPG